MWSTTYVNTGTQVACSFLVFYGGNRPSPYNDVFGAESKQTFMETERQQRCLKLTWAIRRDAENIVYVKQGLLLLNISITATAVGENSVNVFRERIRLQMTQKVI